MSATALPIIDHAWISTSLLLTIPDEPLLAVLQEAIAQITPAVRVRTLLLAKHPIMCTLVNLTLFHRRLCSLLHTVLVTNITDRPAKKSFKTLEENPNSQFYMMYDLDTINTLKDP